MMKQLKVKHRQEIENLKSAFNQIRHKKPRHEENWIPLGLQIDQDENTNESLQRARSALPEPRQPDQLRSIENNKHFQVKRVLCQEASKRIKKIIKSGNQRSGEQNSNKNINTVNSLAKAKELKLKQQTKRKAECQEIDE